MLFFRKDILAILYRKELIAERIIHISLGIYEEKKVSFRDFAEKTYIPYAKTNLSPKTFERCKGIIETHFVSYFDCYLYKISRNDIEGTSRRELKMWNPRR